MKKVKKKAMSSLLQVKDMLLLKERLSEIPSYLISSSGKSSFEYIIKPFYDSRSISSHLIDLFHRDNGNKALLYKPGSKEWELDRSIVTASMIAAVIGEDRYTSREKAFLLKTKQIPPIVQNEAMSNGNIQEPIVAQKFSDKSGLPLFRVGCVKWSMDANISVNPDRVTIDGVNVEIKAPLYDTVHEDEDIEYVLDKQIHYWHQMQLQMLVLDLKKTYFVRYGGPPNKNHTFDPIKHTATSKFKPREVLSIVEVYRDDHWWSNYREKIESFIQEVIKFNEDKNKNKTKIKQ